MRTPHSGKNSLLAPRRGKQKEKTLAFLILRDFYTGIDKLLSVSDDSQVGLSSNVATN